MYEGTFAVQCCFQKAADHADRDNANKRLDGRKLWHTPIHEKMLSKLFRFQEVDLAEVPDEVIPNTLEEAELPESLFQFKLKKCICGCQIYSQLFQCHQVADFLRSDPVGFELRPVHYVLLLQA